MKVFYLGLVLAILTCGCFGQQSDTRGTLTDAGGVVWDYATVTATLQNPMGTPPINIMTGQKVKTVVTANSGAVGQFDIVVDRNDLIVPSGTKWVYKICPVSGEQFCVTTLPQNIVASPFFLTWPPTPAISVSGSRVTNANNINQLAIPTDGELSIVGNSLFIYDVTTNAWIGLSVSQADILAAVNASTISPVAIIGTGPVTRGAGTFTSLSGASLNVSGVSQLGTSIANSAALQVDAVGPCSPTLASGALFSCTVNMTLQVPEPDVNYTPICSANSTATWAGMVSNKTTTNFTVTLLSFISGGGSTTDARCLTFHN